MGTIYKRQPNESVAFMPEGGASTVDLLRKFGPKTPDHPSVGTECPACNRKFEAGDYTTLVTLGPGDDEEAQTRAAEGRPYNAVAVEVHWSCATGDTT